MKNTVISSHPEVAMPPGPFQAGLNGNSHHSSQEFSQIIMSSDTINKGKDSVKRVNNPRLRDFPMDHQVNIVRIAR